MLKILPRLHLASNFFFYLGTIIITKNGATLRIPEGKHCWQELFNLDRMGKISSQTPQGNPFGSLIAMNYSQ